MDRGKGASNREIQTELVRQGIDPSSVLTFLGLLNPSPTKWRLSTVANELVRIWKQYPWFQTARLDAKFSGSAKGLAAIAGQPDWDESPPTSPTGFKNPFGHPIYNSLALVPASQLVEDLRVFYLTVALGYRDTSFKSKPISKLCLRDCGELLDAAILGRVSPEIVAALRLAPEATTVGSRWDEAALTLSQAGLIGPELRDALRIMARIFHEYMEIARWSGNEFVALPAFQATLEQPTTEQADATPKKTRFRSRLRGSGAGPTIKNVVTHIRTPVSPLVRKKPEARSQHRDEISSSDTLVSPPHTDTPFDPGVALPYRVERELATDVFLRANDWLYLRTHWNTLSAPEADQCLSSLAQIARDAANSQTRITLEGAVLGLIIGVTGRQPSRIVNARFCWPGDEAQSPTAERDEFDLSTLNWAHCVPESERRFRPKKHEQPLLESVGANVRLQLPAIVHDAMRSLMAVETQQAAPGPSTLFRTETALLIGECRRIFTSLQHQGTRYTMVRLRRSLPVRVFAASGDLAATMMITGDSWNLSTVGCNYYCARLSSLQQTYASCFSETLADEKSCAVVERVGSRLCIKNDQVLALTQSLRNGLAHVKRNAEKSGPQLAEVHNTLVVYTAMMFIVTVAHRCTRHLEDLTLRNIAIRGGVAVVNDKEVDRGHRGRLTALADMTILQLRALLAHYQALHGRTDTSPALKSRLQAAINGDGSLFLLLDDKELPATLTRKTLRAHLPSSWTLPLNSFRHRLATRLRELGCPPEYVAAQLGHVDLGHQPFGVESPMSPREFADTVAQHTQALLTEDAWCVAYGVVRDVMPLDQIPVGRLSLDAQSIEQRIEAQERQIHFTDQRKRASARRQAAVETDQAVRDAVLQVRPELLDSTAPLTVTEDEIQSIRTVATVEVAGDADRIQWRLNAVRDFFAHGVKQHGWTCAIPSRAFRPFVEVSPYVEGLPAEHEKIRYLRTWFASLNDTQLSRSANINWFLLSLILFQGIVDEERLFAYAHALADARVATSLPDVVLLDVDCGESMSQVARVDGIPALFAIRCYGISTLWRVPAASTFDHWLASVLPAESWPDPTETGALQCLLSSARIALRFDVSGLTRAVLTRQIRSVALPRERALQLIEGDPPLRHHSTLANPEPEALPLAASTNSTRSDTRRDWLLYRRLRRILYHRKGRPKTFGSQRIALAAKTPAKKIREAIVDELKTLAGEASSASRILQLLIAYARQLMVHGTQATPRPALATVYGYVVTIGLRLLVLAPQEDFVALSEGDFIVFYQSGALSNTPEQTNRIATLECFFHRFLVKHFGAEPIDEGELVPYGSREFVVDANIVTPAEYLAARNALGDKILASADSDAISDRQTLFASLIVLIFMWRCSARISEIVLRRFMDLLLTDTGGVLMICPTQFGGLKTRTSTRPSLIDDRYDTTELHWIKQWVEEQRTWLGDRFSPRNPLFPSQSDPATPINPAYIAQVLSGVLRWATGSNGARPHWLRHSGGTLNELCCSSDQRTFKSLAAVTRETWLAPGTTSPSSFRNAFCGRAVLSYRHTIQLSATPGHSRPPTTIGHYVHMIPMSGTAGDREAMRSISGPQRAVMTNISESNLRQLRRRSASPGSTITDDIAVLIAYVPIQQRVAQLSANDPWQLPKLPRAAGTDFSPQDLARFLERLADGIPWSALSTATGLPMEIQRRLCAALIKLHEVAPQAWFPKELLVEFATACSETRLVEDANLLDDRPCRNLPRGWLDEAVVSRLWEIGGNPNDPRHRCMITAAKVLGAGANRRERLVPMARPEELVVCLQALRLLDVDWSRIVIMLVTGYPASRIEAALADAGIEYGLGLFAHVPTLPRVGATSVKLALALRVGIGEPSRLHVNTLAWGFGVLALWRDTMLVT